MSIPADPSVRDDVWRDDSNFYISFYLFSGALAHMLSLVVLYPRLSKHLGKHLTLVLACSMMSCLLSLIGPFGCSEGKHGNFLAKALPHLFWKILLHCSFALVDASVPDMLPVYVPDRYLGFAQGVLIAFRSVGSIASSSAGAVYSNSPMTAFFVLSDSTLASFLAASFSSTMFCSQILA